MTERTACLWMESAPEEQQALVRDDFVEFLRAGGTVTIDDWAAMTPLGRRLASEAGRMLDAERRAALLLDLASAIREARVAASVSAAAAAGAAECAAGGGP